MCYECLHTGIQLVALFIWNILLEYPAPAPTLTSSINVLANVTTWVANVLAPIRHQIIIIHHNDFKLSVAAADVLQLTEKYNMFFSKFRGLWMIYDHFGGLCGVIQNDLSFSSCISSIIIEASLRVKISLDIIIDMPFKAFAKEISDACIIHRGLMWRGRIAFHFIWLESVFTYTFGYQYAIYWYSLITHHIIYSFLMVSNDFETWINAIYLYMRLSTQTLLLCFSAERFWFWS